MEPTQKPTKIDKPLILLDMDGVLCDFVRNAFRAFHEDEITSFTPEELLGLWKTQFPGEWDICNVVANQKNEITGRLDCEEMWRSIHAVGNLFWSHMPETHLYPHLRSLAKRLEAEERASVIVASSPSNHASSYAGKFEWLKSRRINAHSHAMLGSQKHLLAAPGRILVDDNDTNCRKFREHGGRAVLVPQIWNSLHAIAADGEQAQWEYVESQLLEQLEYANLDLGR